MMMLQICAKIFEATTVSNPLQYEAEPWINQARSFNTFLAVEPGILRPTNLQTLRALFSNSVTYFVGKHLMVTIFH